MGVVLYQQQNGLTAAEFDRQRNEISGSPTLIETGNTLSGGATFAQNGTFAYARGQETQSLLMRVALLSPDGIPAVQHHLPPHLRRAA